MNFKLLFRTALFKLYLIDHLITRHCLRINNYSSVTIIVLSVIIIIFELPFRCRVDVKFLNLTRSTPTLDSL